MRRQCTDDRERGSLSPFFVVVTLALLLMVGLVVDGSGQMRAVNRADAVAAEAARAGGQAIVASQAVRGDGAVADPVRARQAAQAYLAQADVSGTVTIINGTSLRVETSVSYQPIFLGLIGIGAVSADGDAQVRLAEIVDGEDR
jgi:Flp pilus assembly protein TadG